MYIHVFVCCCFFMGDGEGAGCHGNVGQGRDYDDEQLNRSILKRYVNAYMYTAFI